MFTEMELHYIYTSVYAMYDIALEDGDSISTAALDGILNKLDDHFQGRS